jgi:hypothetical protein
LDCRHGFAKRVHALQNLPSPVCNWPCLSVKVSQTGTCSNGITHQTIQNLWLYAAVVLLMMGANSTRNM